MTAPKTQKPHLEDSFDTAEIKVGDDKLVVRELTGLQRFILDQESKVRDYKTGDKSLESARAYFDFKCLAIALALEHWTGEKYPELLVKVQSWREETIMAAYDVVGAMIFKPAPDEPEEKTDDPKGHAAG